MHTPGLLSGVCHRFLTLCLQPNCSICEYLWSRSQLHPWQHGQSDTPVQLPGFQESSGQGKLLLQPQKLPHPSWDGSSQLSSPVPSPGCYSQCLTLLHLPSLSFCLWNVLPASTAWDRHWEQPVLGFMGRALHLIPSQPGTPS